MKHKVLAIKDAHPYEIVKVELTGESISELKSIKDGDDVLENYLTLVLNAVDVIENVTPIFVIKRAKQKLGIGS